MASSAPLLGLFSIIFKHVYWYIQQLSGELFQDYACNFGLINIINFIEELYYPCRENKGADQLCSYCEADLRLCFRLSRLMFFPRVGSNVNLL